MEARRGVLHFKKAICVEGFSAACGEKENYGRLKGRFDKVFFDSEFNGMSYEKAESNMQKYVIKKAIEKAGSSPKDLDVIFAGDILNQCIGSNYGVRELQIPFLGLYGACSTMAEAVLMACVFLDSGLVKKTISVTSSNFCAAERQFRFPIEYGGQRPMTAQWTATAAGAIVLGCINKKNIYVKSACIGKILDFGVKDMCNMGAAMAPAAADTLIRFFNETKTTPLDYDLILTGDLGAVGSLLLFELMDEAGYGLKGRHRDCGLILYDREKQDVHSGGSGPGCSAGVLCADILKRIEENELKRVLFVATGALMSTTTNQQGESIPAVAHLIYFSVDMLN